MRHERPAEQDIANMIAPAFDRLPGPDSRRLAAIEQRLLVSARPRRRAIAWWWLAGALVAGAASALWWAMYYDSGELQKEPGAAVMAPPQTPVVADQPARPSRSEGAESKPAGEPVEKHSPLIFKQER